MSSTTNTQTNTKTTISTEPPLSPEELKKDTLESDSVI